MSRANDRELAKQRKVLISACKEACVNAELAAFGFDVGVYAAFRVAVGLIAARDRMKALNECGRLLACFRPTNPPA
jgi:hypothetical protein